MRLILLTLPLFAVALAGAQEELAVPAPDGSGLPEPVSTEHFQVLMENSPFTRSLNLSDLLILTGIASMDGKKVATLMNKETKETYVVSEAPNPQGWKMVEVADNDDIEKVAAKIAIAGGEVVTVRYTEFSAKPGEARPASGGGGEISESRPREGDRRSGFRGPPPEVREKMEKLPEEKRQQLFDYMAKLRTEKPDLSFEERISLFREKLDQMSK